MSTNNQQDKYLLSKRQPAKRIKNYDALSTSKYVQHEEGSLEPLHIGNLNDMQIASIKNNKNSNISKNIREKIKEYGTFTDKDINSIIDEHEKYYGDIEEREGTADFYQDKPEDGTKADLLFAKTNENKIQKRDELINAVEKFVTSDGKTVLDNSEILINNSKQSSHLDNNKITEETKPNQEEKYFYDDDLQGEDKISPYDLLYLYKGTPVADILKEEINKERERKLERTEETDYAFSQRIENILRSVDRYGVESVVNQSDNAANKYYESDKYLTQNTNTTYEYNKSDNLLDNIENPSQSVSTSVEDHFKSKLSSKSIDTLDRLQTAKLNNIRGHIPTSTAFDLYAYRGQKSDGMPKRYNTNNDFDKFSLYSGKEYYHPDNEKEEELLKNGVMAKVLGKKE